MRRAIPFLLVLMAASGSEAVQANLTADQVQEAIAHGKAVFAELRSKGKAPDELDPGYVLDRGPEGGSALLFTEFSVVALETRRFEAIARELGPQDVEQVLAPLRGRLRFTVTLTNGQINFLRHYSARLVQGDRSLQPAQWDVFKGARKPGTTDRWVASATYTFPASDLDLTAPVVLLLSDQAGREARFEFDLGRLR